MDLHPAQQPPGPTPPQAVQVHPQEHSPSPQQHMQPQQQPQQHYQQSQPQQQPMFHHQEPQQQHYQVHGQQPMQYQQQQQPVMHQQQHVEYQPPVLEQPRVVYQQQQQVSQPVQQHYYYQAQPQPQPQSQQIYSDPNQTASHPPHHQVIVQQPQQQVQHNPQPRAPVYHQMQPQVRYQQQQPPQPQEQQQQQQVHLRLPVTHSGQGNITLHRFPAHPAPGQVIRTQNGQVVKVVRLTRAQDFIQGQPLKVLPMRQPHPQQQRPRAAPIRYVHQQQQRQPLAQQQWRQIPPGQQVQQQRMVRPPPPQQQQMHRPQIQQQQGGDPNINYGVIHIFEENGKRVQKMPILVNGETIWAEAKEQTTADANSSNLLSFPLDDADTGAAPSATPAATAANSNEFEPPQQKIVPSNVKKSGQDFKPEDKEAMVQRVMEGISPTVLAEEIGVVPGTIRAWVKAAGHTLPKTYTTKGKVVRKSEQQGANNTVAASVTIAQGQPPQLHLPDQAPTQPPQVLRPSVPGQPGQRPSGLPQQQQQQPRFANRNVGTQQVRPVLMQQQQQQQQQQQHAGKVVTAEASSLNDPAPSSSAPPGMPGAGPTRLKRPGSTFEPYQPKRIPGFLAVCKNCGGIGSDFNRCESCKRPIPEDCKRIPDKNSKRAFESMSSLTVTTMGGDLRNVRIHSKVRKKKPDEPECIAISSDEEENEEQEEEEEEGEQEGKVEGEDKRERQKEGGGEQQQGGEKASSSNSVEGVNGEGKEGTSAEGNEGQGEEDKKKMVTTPKQTEKGSFSMSINQVSDEFILGGMKPNQHFAITTRSVRLGSYKVLAKESALFTATGIQIKLPDRFKSKNELIHVNIKKTDVLKVMAHFNKSCPIIFLYLSPSACAAIRQQLTMDKKYGIWLDIGESDDTMKRVTILPERVTEEGKAILKGIYVNEMEELDNKAANEILVHSSPKEKIQTMIQQQIQDLSSKSSSSSSNSAKSGVTSATPALPMTTKLCQYPPGSVANSINLTMEDYTCLADENFLNDNIIEFYFRWLQHDLMSETDRNRTHFFGTYFYNKLTKKPRSTRNKLHPTEDNQNLTAAEKRYERVRRWTKKVNIFEKDFIVVPINEHSHWFLAVICFPNLRGCRRMVDDAEVETPELQRRLAQRRKERSARAKHHGGSSGKRMLIGSTSIIPIKGSERGPGFRLDDDMYSSDRDEADASDNEMLVEDGDYHRLCREMTNRKHSPVGTPKKGPSPTPKEEEQKKAQKEEQENKEDEEKKNVDSSGDALKLEVPDPSVEKTNDNKEEPTKASEDQPDLSMEVDEEPLKPAGMELPVVEEDMEVSKDREEEMKKDEEKMDSKDESEEKAGKGNSEVGEEKIGQTDGVDDRVEKEEEKQAEKKEEKVVEAEKKAEEGNIKQESGNNPNREAKSGDGDQEKMVDMEKEKENASASEDGEDNMAKNDEKEPEDKSLDKIEDTRTGDDEQKSDIKENKENASNQKKTLKVKNSAVKQPCILIFDSLTTGSHATVAATLREYLSCEYKAKMGETRTFNNENMKGCCPKVPQQPNFSDCGLYLLQYAESFFESPITDFSLPVTNLRKWFTRADMRHKRDKIADIIRSLNKKQFPNKKLPFPKLVFTPERGAGYSSSEEEEEEEVYTRRGQEVTAPAIGKKGETPKKGNVVKTISLSTKGPGAAGTIAAVAAAEKADTTPAKSVVTTSVSSTSSPTVITTSSSQKLIVPSIIKVGKSPSKPLAKEDDSRAKTIPEGASGDGDTETQKQQQLPPQPPAPKHAAQAAAAAAGGGIVIVKTNGKIYVDGTKIPNSAVPNQATKSASKEKSVEVSKPKTSDAAGSSSSSSTVIISKPVSNGLPSSERKSVSSKSGSTNKDGDNERRLPPPAVMSKLDAAFGAAFRRPSTEEQSPSTPKEVEPIESADKDVDANNGPPNKRQKLSDKSDLLKSEASGDGNIGEDDFDLVQNTEHSSSSDTCTTTTKAVRGSDCASDIASAT